MKNLTLRQRILASFLVILAIMALMVVVDYRRLLVIESQAELINNDAVPGIYYSTSIRASWFAGFVTVQDAFSTDTEQARNSVLEALPRNDEVLEDHIEQYRRTVSRKDDRQMFEEFERELQEYRRIRAEILAPATLLANPELAQARIKAELRPAFYKGRDILAQMVVENKKQADEAAVAIRESVETAEAGMLVSLAMAIAAAIVCGFLLMRAIANPMRAIVKTLESTGGGDLTRRLALARKDEFNTIEAGFNGMVDELTGLVGKTQRSAVQVATSVTEIAATSKQQQATASEVAATTTEIGVTSREISATSRELVRTMTEVSSAAEQTAALAGSGQVGLARMEDTMRNVVGAAGSVNAKLAILNEKAGNITQVVTTITKVADQTNLLSLNAAIEAEKAGEYGRGFVVVATEIRRLADQTAVATYDIEQMVREIQSSVSAGVMGMDKFSEEVRRGMADMQQVGDQLSQIIQQVQTLAPRVQMVNEGMQAQATGAEQINQALQQLSDAAQQTVESLRQSTLAIEELTLVANDLRSGVSRFKV
jgi:methyl-accepting chemotaxis protein WspA